MTLDSLVSKKLNININIQLLYTLLNFIICLKYWILKRCILFFFHKHVFSFLFHNTECLHHDEKAWGKTKTSTKRTTSRQTALMKPMWKRSSPWATTDCMLSTPWESPETTSKWQKRFWKHLLNNEVGGH